MFALLGDIELNLATTPDSFENSTGTAFAELSRITGKPGLQFTGHQLDKYSLNFTLHYRQCSPAAVWAEINAARLSHKALALVVGDDYRGWFVITDASCRLTLAGPDGQIQALEISLTLQEFTGDPHAPPEPLAVKSDLSAVTAIARPELPAPGISGLAHTAVTAARAAQSALSTAAGMIRLSRQFRNNPLAAIDRIPGMIARLGHISAPLEQALPALTGLSATLPEAARLARTLSQTATLIASGSATLHGISRHNPASLSGALDRVAGIVGEATTLMDSVSPWLSRLAARMITRSL